MDISAPRQTLKEMNEELQIGHFAQKNHLRKGREHFVTSQYQKIDPSAAQKLLATFLDTNVCMSEAEQGVRDGVKETEHKNEWKLLSSLVGLDKIVRASGR